MGEILVGCGAGRRESAYSESISKTGEKRKVEGAREGGQ
jgi:hypothetical protein